MSQSSVSTYHNLSVTHLRAAMRSSDLHRTLDGSDTAFEVAVAWDLHPRVSPRIIGRCVLVLPSRTDTASNELTPLMKGSSQISVI